MASGRHGRARTGRRVRARLQAAQAPTHAPTAARTARSGLNPESVGRWRRRSRSADAPSGPGRRCRTTRTEAEEAIVVEFSRRTSCAATPSSAASAGPHPDAHPLGAAPLPDPSWHLAPAPRRGERLQARPLRRNHQLLRPRRRPRTAPGRTDHRTSRPSTTQTSPPRRRIACRSSSPTTSAGISTPGDGVPRFRPPAMSWPRTRQPSGPTRTTSSRDQTLGARQTMGIALLITRQRHGGTAAPASRSFNTPVLCRSRPAQGLTRNMPGGPARRLLASPRRAR